MYNVQLLGYTPYGYEQINVTALAVSRLNQALREDTRLKSIYLTVEDNPIHFRIDGGNPTVANGHLILANYGVIFNDQASARDMRMIAIGNNALVMVTYFI